MGDVWEVISEKTGEVVGRVLSPPGKNVYPFTGYLTYNTATKEYRRVFDNPAHVR